MLDYFLLRILFSRHVYTGINPVQGGPRGYFRTSAQNEPGRLLRVRSKNALSPFQVCQNRAKDHFSRSLFSRVNFLDFLNEPIDYWLYKSNAGVKTDNYTIGELRLEKIHIHTQTRSWHSFRDETKKIFDIVT